MKKRILKITFWFIVGIIALFLLILIAFHVSPRPGALVIKRAFDSKVLITDEKGYQRAKKNVEIISDQSYQSKLKDNVFDIYYPKDTHQPVPVLVWAHGGGFVAGDKEGIKEFATKIVLDTKIAVISMNYETAPDSQYPNQLLQMGELIKTLEEKKFKMLDLSQILFGGDSAGAQIALQYVTTQTNRNYAKSIGIDQILNISEIKGAISYCGPVDLQQTAQKQSTSKFMKFFVDTVAWSEIGTKDWKENPKLFEASLVRHVTKDFPPTYITDGNAYSFQNQGIALEKRLKQLKVPVQGLFYINDKKKITHEYQFDYEMKEAKNCYAQTVAFINEYK